MAWALGLALPAAAAAALSWRLAVTFRTRLALCAALLGVFAGAASVPWSALFFSGIRSRGVLLGLDAAVWLAVIAGAALARSRGDRSAATVTSATGRVVTIAAVAAALVLMAGAAWSFAAASAVAPHGEWDAWAQWNLRARFFFRGFADGTWTSAFAPVLAWSHPDYPPLVPASVARLWMYAGSETLAAPIALAALLSSCTVLTAGFSIASRRGTARGCLAAAAILACPSFVRYAPSQCADIPLAFFMLAAFVMWERGYLALAGVSAALAAWTKNEGLAFLGIFMAVLVIDRLRSEGWRGLAALWPALAGAAPVLLVLLVFKQTLAPPSYFVEEQTLAQALTKLSDVGRIRFVARALGGELWLTGGSLVGVVPVVAVFAALRGLDGRAPSAARWAAPVMILMLVTYGLAYAITPKDLVWQLKTSLDRVVMQLVPTLVWSLVAATR
jgi:hypothetical protein